MKSLSRLVVAVVLLVIVGTAVFLVAWDIPPPVARVEKVVPDDRFPR